MEQDDTAQGINLRPPKLLGLKPERGYIMWLPSGQVVYEMRLEMSHMEMVMQQKMMIVDATEMTFFDPKDGEWIKLMSLSEMVEHGKRIAKNDNKSKDSGVVASNAGNKKLKKERKT